MVQLKKKVGNERKISQKENEKDQTELKATFNLEEIKRSIKPKQRKKTKHKRQLLRDFRTRADLKVQNNRKYKMKVNLKNKSRRKNVKLTGCQWTIV